MRIENQRLFFRSLILVGLLSLFCTFSSAAQNITGVWLTENEEAKIEIYKQDGEFFGKIIWTKEQTEQAQKSIGVVVLKNFVRQKDNTYKGSIFEPRLDKIFKGVITLKNENELVVRGYLGFSFLGGSQRWERAKS